MAAVTPVGTAVSGSAAVPVDSNPGMAGVMPTVLLGSTTGGSHRRSALVVQHATGANVTYDAYAPPVPPEDNLKTGADMTSPLTDEAAVAQLTLVR